MNAYCIIKSVPAVQLIRLKADNKGYRTCKEEFRGIPPVIRLQLFFQSTNIFIARFYLDSLLFFTFRRYVGEEQSGPSWRWLGNGGWVCCFGALSIGQVGLQFFGVHWIPRGSDKWGRDSYMGSKKSSFFFNSRLFQVPSWYPPPKKKPFIFPNSNFKLRTSRIVRES